MRTAALIVALALTAFTASAATYSLTNTASPVDINVAGNWDGGVVPGPDDDVEIVNPGPQTLNFSGGSDMVWNSLRLYGTNNVTKSFDIGPGRSLTILNGVRVANEAGATNRLAWLSGSLFITNDSRSSTLTVGFCAPGGTAVGSGSLGWGNSTTWTVIVDRVDVITNAPPNVSPFNFLNANQPQAVFEVRNGGTNFTGNVTYDTMFKLSGGFWRRHNGYDNSYTEMLISRGGIWLDGPTTYFRNDVANGNFRSSSTPGALMIITNGATFESARTSAGGTWAVGDASAKGARMFIVDNGVLTTRMNSITLGAVGNNQKSGTNSIYIGSGGKIYSTHGWVARATGNNAANAQTFNHRLTITGSGSEWRCRDSFFFAWCDTTGTAANVRLDTNTVTIADGGLLMATGVFSIGFLYPGASCAFTDNKVILDNGTIIVTSRYNTGTFEVRNGRFIMNGGLVLCDRFIATNAPNSIVELSGGALEVKQGAMIAGAALTNYGAMSFSTLLLDAGSILAGTGQVNGAVTFANASALAPGLSAGTITFGGDVAMNGGAQYTWEKGAGPAVADKAVIGGNLTIDNAVTVQVVALSGATPGGPVETNTVFEVGGLLSGFDNLVLDFSLTPGWNGVLIQDGQDVNVVLVPEPAVFALAGLALAVAFRRR
ncbi:hypothetical protein GX586_08910 [bacterium]|nr:hypothetical protein [bacterium]